MLIEKKKISKLTSNENNPNWCELKTYVTST